MYREWSDPRDGTVWLVQVFHGTAQDPFGRARAVPRMLAFRLPADVESAAEELHSVPLRGDERFHDLADQDLMALLDRGRTLSRGKDRSGP